MRFVPVSVHEQNLRALPCVVSYLRPVTLHHCHGGSMLELGPEFPNPGIGQRANPFFQIPIHARFHVGEFGVDHGQGSYKGVVAWEDQFGKQTELLNDVNGRLDYDLWEQARLWEQANRA